MVQGQCLHVKVPPRQRLGALTSSAPGRITEAHLSTLWGTFLYFQTQTTVRDTQRHSYKVTICPRTWYDLYRRLGSGRVGSGRLHYPHACHGLVPPARAVTVPGSTSRPHDTILSVRSLSSPLTPLSLRPYTGPWVPVACLGPPPPLLAQLRATA